MQYVAVFSERVIGSVIQIVEFGVGGFRFFREEKPGNDDKHDARGGKAESPSDRYSLKGDLVVVCRYDEKFRETCEEHACNEDDCLRVGKPKRHIGAYSFLFGMGKKKKCNDSRGEKDSVSDKSGKSRKGSECFAGIVRISELQPWKEEGKNKCSRHEKDKSPRKGKSSCTETDS